MSGKVLFNGKEASIFPGMKVRHLLSREELKSVESGKKDVFDKHGNVTGLDGELTDGNELFLQPIK